MSHSDDVDTREYQFGGDYVVSSGASAGAWVSATYPVDVEEVA